MLNTLLLPAAIICYLAATFWVGHYIKSGSASDEQHKSLQVAFLIAWMALLLHIIYAYQISIIEDGFDSSLSAMAVLVSAILVLIFQLGCLAIPIRRLGVLVFPLTILSLVFSFFWSGESNATQHLRGALGAHVLVSIVAYCLLAIASIQALLYVYQEQQIKNRATPTMLMALPPLQTMETLLFRLIWVGFALLSLTLVTGAIFSKELFGHALEFKHHTILALLGWLVFAILLYKRTTLGLRGMQAAAWTLGGFLLIQLGYFGTKFVSESLAVQ